MRRKLFVITIAFIVVFLFVACDSASQLSDNISQTVARTTQGEIEVSAGKPNSTQWFDFTIEHVKKTASYAGYSPADGYMLIDVLITQKGTFDDTEPVPMGTFDFYMDSSIFEESIYPIPPIDDTMMPGEFDLVYGETAVYHMVYEIPSDIPDLKLMFTEWDEGGREGATFVMVINPGGL